MVVVAVGEPLGAGVAVEVAVGEAVAEGDTLEAGGAVVLVGFNVAVGVDEDEHPVKLANIAARAITSNIKLK